MTLNYAFMYLILVLLVIALWTFPAGLVANTARLKGRTWASFYVLGIASSWLFTATIVASITRTRHVSELRPCSDCRERIGKDAAVCGHCGSAQTASLAWQDQQILSRIKNQRLLALAAIGSAILMFMFLVVLVNYPAPPSATDFEDVEQYIAALALHLNSYLISWVALISSSSGFAIAVGAWVSRELGHPSSRLKVTGEPFYSTKASDNV